MNLFAFTIRLTGFKRFGLINQKVKISLYLLETLGAINHKRTMLWIPPGHAGIKEA
jgi:hypothetical protein